MEETISDKELMAIAALFLTMHESSKNKNIKDKRERKAIMRSINKQLAIASKVMIRTQYLKVVHEASAVRLRAYKEMDLEGMSRTRLNKVSPSGLIDSINKQDPSLLSRLNISEKHLESMRVKYANDNLTLASLMYGRRIVKEIEKGIENIKSITDEEIMEVSKKLVEEHRK